MSEIEQLDQGQNKERVAQEARLPLQAIQIATQGGWRTVGVYLDQNVDVALMASFQSLGIAVEHSHFVGMDHSDDEAQLDYATDQRRILLTHNGKHFRRLHRDWKKVGRSHGGIITLRKPVPVARAHARFVAAYLYLTGVLPNVSTFVTWGTVQDFLNQGGFIPDLTSELLRQIEVPS